MTTTMTRTPSTIQTDAYRAAFDTLDPESPVHALREKGFGYFSELGFPTLRHEEWRYTNVKPIAATDWVLAAGGDERITKDLIRRHFLNETPCHQIVFVNGHYAPALSEIGELNDGARLEPLSSVIANDFAAVEPHLGRHTDMDRDAFAALNTAFISHGAYLHIPANVEMEKPVHIIFLAAPNGNAMMAHPRVLVVAEACSKATVVETYADEGEGAYFTNTVTEIVAGEGANIDHYKVERESPEAYHVSSLNVHQERDSNVTSHNFSIGGKLVRNNLNGVLNAEGCHSTFNGLVMGRGTQHVDNHLMVDHLKPNCNSWEYYKTILDEKAKGVFTGRIYVAKDAQKTDAKQTSANLLLSETAHVTAKPQLEIFADDVKCTHGATIGQLEEDQLFYLQSRGIDAETARSLLIYAFANETISEINVEEIRHKLEDMLLNRLPHGHDLQGGL